MADDHTPAGPALRPAFRAALPIVLVTTALAGCASGGQAKTGASATTSASQTWSVGTPGVSPTGATGVPSPTVTGPSASPAQPSADAQRDGIEPSIAALAPNARIRRVPAGSGGGATQANTPEGLWMVSRPAGATTYGELLLLDPSGQRIRRAYPFHGVAPQWLMVTSGAIYCGRAGDQATPDAMVCRVDRVSGELRVRILADKTDDTVLIEKDVSGRPGRWAIDDRNFPVDYAKPGRLQPTELVFTTTSGGLIRFDPDTLQVIGS